jgi:hypothetical protein
MGVPVREPLIPRESRRAEVEPPPRAHEEDDIEEVGRPEGPLEERRIDPFGIGPVEELAPEPTAAEEPWYEPTSEVEPESPAAWPEPEQDLSSGEAGEDPETAEDTPAPGAPDVEGGPPGEPRYGRRRGRKR